MRARCVPIAGARQEGSMSVRHSPVSACAPSALGDKASRDKASIDYSPSNAKIFHMELDRASNPLDLPPALLAEVEAAANEEHRPVIDVLCELVEHGLNERRWMIHAEQERQRGCQAGLSDGGQPMTDEYRHILHEKIAQGMRSLRAGDFADGETFMAQMNAELAALEQQERE